jgi:hypothetical protein
MKTLGTLRDVVHSPALLGLLAGSIIVAFVAGVATAHTFGLDRQHQASAMTGNHCVLRSENACRAGSDTQRWML